MTKEKIKVKAEKQEEKEEKKEQHHNSYRDVKKNYFQTCTQYTLNGYSLF